jgi:hypothetical protein
MYCRALEDRNRLVELCPGDPYIWEARAELLDAMAIQGEVKQDASASDWKRVEEWTGKSFRQTLLSSPPDHTVIAFDAPVSSVKKSPVPSVPSVKSLVPSVPSVKSPKNISNAFSRGTDVKASFASMVAGSSSSPLVTPSRSSIPLIPSLDPKPNSVTILASIASPSLTTRKEGEPDVVIHADPAAHADPSARADVNARTDVNVQTDVTAQAGRVAKVDLETQKGAISRFATAVSAASTSHLYSSTHSSSTAGTQARSLSTGTRSEGKMAASPTIITSGPSPVSAKSMDEKWSASWTSKEVGEWMAHFGPAYAGYTKIAIDNGIRGSVLARMAKMDTDRAERMLKSVGITNEMHIECLLMALHE